jgi:hypothetical protein
MSAAKTRTITLTDRPPVTIREDDWPVIASARWWDGEYECQANLTVSVRVREREHDGRRIVYGVWDSQRRHERSQRAGRVVDGVDGQPDSARTIAAIHDVCTRIGRPDLAADCVADLPAEDL